MPFLNIMEDEYIGAVKVYDGLFMGDKDSSQDLDFLVSSKVSHILNCSSSEVKDEWVSIGITYLSFPFQDSDNEIIFDESTDTFPKCFEFIDSCLDSGSSILIHSVKGESRCVTVVLSYLMNKYKWSLTKSLEFLNSRKPDCKIKPNFLFQLVKLENQLAKSLGHSLSKTWDLTEDLLEVVLRNTFLNSKPGEFVKHESGKARKKRKIKWIDGFVETRRVQSASSKRIMKSVAVLKKQGNESRRVVKEDRVVEKQGLCLKENSKVIVPCLRKLDENGKCVLGNVSKSLNSLATKNLSDSTKEHFCFEDLKVKRTLRNNSVSKRENSPLVKEFKRSEAKSKKKISGFALFGFVETAKSSKRDTPLKSRTGSAKPSSPYIYKQKGSLL